MNRRDALKRLLIAPFAPISVFAPRTVFASKPVLPSLQHNHNFSKQSLQLDQILPRATRQTFENVTVYSTVGPVTQQKLERWSRSWDILIKMLGWWWIDQIPRPFKIIMVSESEFDQIWRTHFTEGHTGVALFNYPDELWSRGYNDQDWWVIHEALHRILSWIYRDNIAFQNLSKPGSSPLIIAAAELAVNILKSELGPNSNPVINLVRFNRLWEVTKEIMQTAGFIGLERISPPQIVDICQGCEGGGVSRISYERWQIYNRTGEIYLAIRMFSAILYVYNSHRDGTDIIYSIAVCNAKKILDRELGFIQFEQSFPFC